jgi:hypothetical protein
MPSLAATAGRKKSRWFGDAGSADAHLKQRRDLLKFQTGKSLEISISIVSPEFAQLISETILPLYLSSYNLIHKAADLLNLQTANRLNVAVTL